VPNHGFGLAVLWPSPSVSSIENILARNARRVRVLSLPLTTSPRFVTRKPAPTAEPRAPSVPRVPRPRSGVQNGERGLKGEKYTIRCELTSVCLLECVQSGMCTRVTRCVLSKCCGNDTPGPSPQPSHPPSLSLSSMLVAVCPHHLLRCRSWLSPGKAPRALHALQRRPQPRPVRRRSSRTNDVTRGLRQPARARRLKCRPAGRPLCSTARQCRSCTSTTRASPRA
jgi:hypothetical protein